MLDTDRALRLLMDHCSDTIHLVDVGARWGYSPKWSHLGERATILCFEPDPEECSRLNKECSQNVSYHQTALFDSDCERDLTVTSEPACRSLFEPLPVLYQHFPGLHLTAPVARRRVSCRSLDAVMAEMGSPVVHAMKLDTQGSELAILRGSASTLRHCVIVETEVEFNEIYREQGLFCDLDRFMRDQGFVLWRLENLAHYCQEPVLAAHATLAVYSDPNPHTSVFAPNGQLYWSQAHYVRAEYPRTGKEHMALDEAITPAILAGAHGFWDLTLEIIRKTGSTDLLTELRGCLLA